MDYLDSGVNIEFGDAASKILYNASKLTWNNRKGKFGEVIEPFALFSGLRGIDVSELPKGTVMGMNSDGIGTKVEAYERSSHHENAAFDLFAMVCDDAVVRGAEPVLLISILDVRSMGEKGSDYLNFVQQLADGYVKAAKAAGVAVINGEIAELGTRISGFGPFNYNWGAGIAWFAKKERLLTGKEIKSDDYIVSLKENGFRSNGFSLVRRIFSQYYGNQWHEYCHSKKKIGNLVMEPSKIYTKAIIEMNGGYAGEPQAEIHGVVHVTGGGVPGKLGRVLRPSGYGAVLDDLFKPCQIMRHAQELGKVSGEEAYRTWNMGQGMLVITPDPEKVIEIAAEYKIGVKVAGEIRSEPKIEIKNKGTDKHYKPWLKF